MNSAHELQTALPQLSIFLAVGSQAAGIALICVSGIAATVLRARAAPGAPGEEH